MRCLDRCGFTAFRLLLTAFLFSCGGGGNSGSSNPSGNTWRVTPDGITGDSSVILSQNLSQSSADVLAFDIVVHSVTSDPVYGAAFDLDFDSSVIAWNGTGSSNCAGVATGCMVGSFLEQTSVNGVLYNVALQQGTTNTLVIGVTQSSNDPGAAGSGTLLTLLFKRVAAGSTPLAFSNNAVRSPPPSSSEILGITWIGVTVMAQ